MYFDYASCTVEELADFVEVSSCQKITSQLIYYKNKRNEVMISKITEARKIVKRRKLLRQLGSC
jgi:hypothetical protein